MVLTEAGAAGSGECVVITGAGSDDANGVYVATGKKWHDAQVYENDAKCLLSREPHKDKDGKTSYGWILGQDRKPLYAVQASTLTPPTSGWRKFKGALPLPQVAGPIDYAEGALAAAEGFKEAGKELFKANKYSEAEHRWTRALSLTVAKDAALKVALYSNRSEARLRLSKFDAALSDAQEAMKIKPTHDKALLRAAVAAREMKMYGESYEFVQKVLAVHPRHMEAKVLLADLEYLIKDAQSSQQDLASMARQKMEESIKRQEEEVRGKKLTASDMNMVNGVKAFSGYGDKREKIAASRDERPPLSALPYHHVGLPGDQVQTMDKFFQEQRDKKDFEKFNAKKQKEHYAKVKEQFKARAQEDVQEGRMADLDAIFKHGKPGLGDSELARPTPKGPELALTGATAKIAQAAKVTLDASETSEIDGLFAGLPTKAAQPLVPTSAASSKKKQLEAARAKILA